MTKLVGGDGRTHIESRLMRESLQDRKVLSNTDSERDLQIFPDVTLVSIGGQSIFDRGKDAILPLVAEIAEVKKRHKIVIGVGGGTRVRHTMSIAIDLGLPTGGIAQLVGAMEELNAILLKVEQMKREAAEQAESKAAAQKTNPAPAGAGSAPSKPE